MHLVCASKKGKYKKHANVGAPLAGTGLLELLNKPVLNNCQLCQTIIYIHLYHK